MFKTIEECRLELVEYSVQVADSNGTYFPDTDSYIKPANMLGVSAARASHGKEDKTGENPAKDVKLMHYLADHQHMTPFEYQHATFLVECPLFIRSQIHRHRTFSFNEISRRYTSENLEFWIPDKFRGQAKNNKQASDGVVDDQKLCRDQFDNATLTGLHMYNALISGGVAREIARAVLPQNLLTRFYMGGVLRNWAHFIELRRDPHAQYEVQVIANRVAERLRALWPESCDALNI